jgi:acetyl esterase/lipase
MVHLAHRVKTCGREQRRTTLARPRARARAAMTAGRGRRGGRAARRLAAALLAVIAGVIAGLAWYSTSLQPGAALVASVFNSNPLVQPPPGFGAVARSVTERRVAVAVRDAPAAHLDIYTPDAAAGRPRPVIMWVHGGGFISSSAATVADYAILLAHAGYTVASLDYSLAPGSRYPVPVRQGNAALRYLRAHARQFGGDPDRIALGGDSAGAQIASQLAAVQTDPALARAMGLTAAVPRGALRGVVLFCGLYDMRTVSGSGFPGLRTYLWAYTGARDWTSYPAIGQLSTTRHVTARYPPTFLSVGDADPFRFQATELAAALTRSAVPLTTVFWAGTGDHLGHEYQFNFELPQARAAFRRLLGFLAGTGG